MVSLRRLTALFLLFPLALCGCEKKTVVGEIVVRPATDVPAGGQASVGITVENPPEGQQLKFVWNAKGEIKTRSETSPGGIYTAPPEPRSVDTITCEVWSGDKLIKTKFATIIVTKPPVVVRPEDYTPPPINAPKNDAQPTPPATPPVTTEPLAGKAPKISPRSADQPTLPVKVNPLSVPASFFPGLWMGDGEEGEIYVNVQAEWKENPHSPPTCYKWTYKPGPNRWAAVGWVYPDKNVGEKPGRNLKGYSKVTFWVKGQGGGELLTFKAGGHTQPSLPYQASFEAAIGPVMLTRDWQKQVIDLKGQDLSSVICAFVWVATADGNPNGCTFYLDDLQYE